MTIAPDICALCGGTLDDGRGWDRGNNPAPVFPPGTKHRVCDWCDEWVVLPVRTHWHRHEAALLAALDARGRKKLAEVKGG